MPIPTTVVVDVQNVYGLSGAVLRSRAKPSPSGIVAALAPYGFEVDLIDAPIAVPDPGDFARTATTRAAVGAELEAARAVLVATTGGPSAHRLRLACGGVEGAVAAICSELPAGGDLILRLTAVNGLANRARKCLKDALAALERATEELVTDAKHRHRVPASHVEDLHALMQERAHLVTIDRSVRALSSYAFAGRNNLAHLQELEKPNGLVRVVASPGRLRLGYAGRAPDEKRIDTMCAVACLERTREALEADEPRAVVLLSDDDDLTPAARAAVRLAAGSKVRVYVAGSRVVQDRFVYGGASEDRPRWIVLDQNAWHHLVGEDPFKALLQRQQLAKLALGLPLPFGPDRLPGLAVTAQGLPAQLSDPSAVLPAPLYLERFRWSFEETETFNVPRAVVATTAPGAPPGRTVRCPPARGTQVDVGRIPVQADAGPALSHVEVPAPGWWAAGDELVIAPAARGGTDAWRVVGPAPTSSPKPLTGAERGRIQRLRLTEFGGAVWATVRLERGPVSVLANAGVGLSLGDEVAVVAYERDASGLPPRAVLLSSAL